MTENREHPLRAWRRKRRMTQIDLAALAGVSQAKISEIETGACGFSIDTMRRLMEATGLKAQAFLDPLLPDQS